MKNYPPIDMRKVRFELLTEEMREMLSVARENKIALRAFTFALNHPQAAEVYTLILNEHMFQKVEIPGDFVDELVNELQIADYKGLQNFLEDIYFAELEHYHNGVMKFLPTDEDKSQIIDKLYNYAVVSPKHFLCSYIIGLITGIKYQQAYQQQREVA